MTIDDSLRLRGLSKRQKDNMAHEGKCASRAGTDPRILSRTRWRWAGLFLSLTMVPLPLAVADDATSSNPTTSAEISAEELMASPFAAFFKADEYEQALEALQPILERYPADPLVLRYQAMTLDRLGRSEEAVAIYQQLLRRDPDHAPTHFFLGQAYERLGQREPAAKEWQWVRQRSPAREYRQWAQVALGRLGGGREIVPERKRWALLGNVGWDWDSNVLLKPSDKALASTGDQNANRFSIDLGLRYRALTNRQAQVDIFYTSRQSLHDDSFDDLNFTSQEIGLDLQHRRNLGGREVIFGSRYELLGGFLESDLFSLSNRWLLSAQTRLTARTRTMLSNRFTVSNFGPDGSNPPQTSRDGLYDDLALTQYLYSQDFQRYVFARQEYNAAWTRGGNYERRGTTTRVGLHTPLVWRTDGDLSGGLQWNVYPRFTSLTSLDPARRRDTSWDVAVALTHHLRPNLDLRLQYRWINALNRNDVFQYDRHLAGAHLLFTQTF